MSAVAASSAIEFKPSSVASRRAFAGLLLRDLHVLRINAQQFAIRTIMQPLLLVFVFTYVFPKIGQGVGGSRQAEAAFSTLLMAGVMATSLVFQGVQAVALPLVQEFGYTREIEDRVVAPLPVWWVAIEKIVSGAVQGMLAALVVFPLAAFIPLTPVHLTVRWEFLLTVFPLAAWVGASLGLVMGTRVAPQQVPLLFSIVVIPITFLGAIYYPWSHLAPIWWLQDLVLVNPLVYMSEGFRMALTSGVPPHERSRDLRSPARVRGAAHVARCAGLPAPRARLRPGRARSGATFDRPARRARGSPVRGMTRPPAVCQPSIGTKEGVGCPNA